MLRNIGLIGSNGYIGSFLHDNLLKEGHKVVQLDYRCIPIDVYALRQFEIVIYTGGVTTRTLCGNLSGEVISQKNVTDIVEVASLLDESQTFVYLSSAAVYEGYGGAPQTEEATINEALLDPYTLSMYNKEMAVRRLPVKSVGLRMGMTCGISRKQRFDLAFMRMVHSALTEGVVYMDTNNPFRSVLGLRDLFRCVQRIVVEANPMKGHHIFNLSSFNTNAAELVAYISSELNASVELKPLSKKINAVGFTADASKFCETFGFTFEETAESILKVFLEHKAVFHRFTSKCRVCKASNMELVLDMGNQALANNLLLDEESQPQEYPLNIYRCCACHHTQLGCTVPPSEMFDSYTYLSGVSSSAVEHFNMLAEYLASHAKGRESVLEIACNDGCQLDFFRAAGFRTYGVDPASNICDMSRKKGHTVLLGYWGEEAFDSLPPKFDVILAQNVLAHVPDPVKFVNKCVDYMTDDTILYLQTSQSEMYLNNEFDTVYHEHMSFFTLESFKHLAEKCSLCIADVKKFPIHGVSYGVFLKKGGGHCAALHSLLQDEHSKGMYTAHFYYQYRCNVVQFKYDMLKLLEGYRKDHTIVAYGAAAKGITMLNYIHFEHIDYIVDDCTFKYGKYSPGLNIPIVSKDVLAADQRNLMVIILPWNIKEELMAKIKLLLSNRTFKILNTFPKINVVPY